jgi:hypothetical protein
MNALTQSLRRIFRGKTPREVLVEQATQAALDRALHASHREYHAAMEKMLVERSLRLDRELRSFEGSPNA